MALPHSIRVITRFAADVVGDEAAAMPGIARAAQRAARLGISGFAALSTPSTAPARHARSGSGTGREA
jgi:hypothetical protein